ncbi:MAG TPA: ABC transporter permease [Acidimicrobiales bacterium]|nr:ABC transporter permease [Acidimicrobiales bacterium]
MSWRRVLATSRRVLQQLGHDPRTIGLLLVVPSVLMGLLAWILEHRRETFDAIGPPLLGIFPLVVMFLVTSVATLRERTSGTLERLLTLPLSKAEFVLGYALSFGLASVVQAALVSGLSFWVFGLHVAGSAWLISLIAVEDALLGTAMGLALSSLAATEFQAVQFMPAFILPQTLLCGLFVPREQLPTALHWLSDVLPMSYAVDATRHLSDPVSSGGRWILDAGVIFAFVVVALASGAATLRRRTR